MREPREPRAMGDLLRTLVAGRGWDERLAVGRLRAAWPTVVGENVAGRCEPLKLFRGVLTLRAEAGAWANELTLLAPSLATRVDDYLGGGLVHEVKIVAGKVGSNG